MTALKGRAIEEFLARPDFTTGVVVVYGPDAGKVREASDRLAAHALGENFDPLNRIVLDGDSVIAETLIAEANTASLFSSGGRAVIIRNAGNSLVPALEALAENSAALVIAEAGSLSPGDGLRKFAEKSAQARALPCYADDDRAIETLIGSHFREAGIAITPEAARALREILGNDRAVTRAELDKLSLYAHETRKITEADVLLLCGDNAGLAIDAILDAVGTGHLEEFDAAFSRAMDAGNDVSMILGSALNHFTALRIMRAEFDSGKSPQEAVQMNRVHFSRARAVEQQIRAWSDAALKRGAARLYEAIAETRKKSSLDIAIARQTLLSLAASAARL